MIWSWKGEFEGIIPSTVQPKEQLDLTGPPAVVQYCREAVPLSRIFQNWYLSRIFFKTGIFRGLFSKLVFFEDFFQNWYFSRIFRKERWLTELRWAGGRGHVVSHMLSLKGGSAQQKGTRKVSKNSHIVLRQMVGKIRNLHCSQI